MLGILNLYNLESPRKEVFSHCWNQTCQSQFGYHTEVTQNNVCQRCVWCKTPQTLCLRTLVEVYPAIIDMKPSVSFILSVIIGSLINLTSSSEGYDPTSIDVAIHANHHFQVSADSIPLACHEQHMFQAPKPQAVTQVGCHCYQLHFMAHAF